MKSLLALTLVVSAAIAASAPRHTLTPNYYEHLDAETPVHRVKRASGFKSACPAGWTGQFCESPICDTQGPKLEPVETDIDKTVDVLHLPMECTGEYYLPYDSTTNMITITVTTDAQTRATAVLTGPTGAVPKPISSEYPNDRTAIYRFVASPNPYVLSFDMNAHSNECIVHIQARSTLSFDIGWVAAPQIDVSQYGEAMFDSRPQYFLAHPFNVVAPAEIKTMTVRQTRYLQPEYRSILSRRYGCSYEYYAGQYQCTSGFGYIQQIEGIDAKGFAFRRSRLFECLADTKPTLVPATDIPVTQCQNGGSLLYNNETETNFCFCTELTAGTNCEELLCMNGGILVDGKKDECDCLPGFVGRNCDNVVCDPDVGKLLTDTKTLAVVIRNSKSMAVHIPKILNAIDEEILHHMIDGRTVYDGYILSYERNGVVTAKYYAPKDFALFGSAIESLAGTYSSDVACTESLVPALEAVYRTRIMDQSPIFIFTDAAPEPSDTDQFKDIMRINANNRMQIHTFFMNTQANCKQNPNIKFYRDLARYTAGLVHMPPADMLDKTFQNAMRATTYKMNLVESADLNQCAMKTKSLIVDYNSENLILIATGKNLRIDVTDPEWNTQMKQPFYDDGTTHFFIIGNPRGGEWLYAIQGDESDDFGTPCSYRFYSQSDFDLFLGTTSSVDIDERTFEPVVGQAAHLIAQVNGFYGGYVQDHFRLFSEILITSPDADDKHQPLYYSNGIFRSSCGFHLYFGVANFCQTEDQIFYATVFVDDQMGFPVQRAAVGYCNAGENPPDPGSDDCQNGGVRVNETTCWCPTHFSGPTCLVPQCLNGGQLSRDQTRCECPSGLSGLFCEMMECTTKADKWEATTEHRTLNFVVSTRSSMKATVKALADGAATFAGYYQLNHPTWIDHFAIVTVNQTGADLHLTHSPQEFAQVFRDISDNFDSYTNYDDDNCTVLLNKGISSAIAASYENSNIFVFADSQAEQMVLPDILNILDRADELHLTVTLFGTDYNMCDGSGMFGDQEQNVVAFTGGKTLFTDKVDRVFDYIDTMYSSGVVFEATYDRCNTDGAVIDFPLEASAHSVVVTVEAAGSGMVMQTPDETPGMYHDQLISGKQFSVQQFIQACPPMWDTNDNMCYFWDTNDVQWITALVGCGGKDTTKGTSLITIFDDKKHDQVQQELTGATQGIWLALYRNSQTGKFNWMQAGVDPVPLDAGLEKYFAPGQDMNDMSKQYVYMKADGKWYLDDVTGRHWTMCQKDRYGRSYDPVASEPDLPPGFWKLTVSSSSPSCNVQVRVQSDLQIFFGFSQDPHVDFKRGTANVDSKTNYVVAKAVGLDGFVQDPDIPEGRIDYSAIAADGKIVYPLAMTERAQSCTFDSISKVPFTCPSQKSLSEIIVKFQGIDQFGYAFERSLVSRCDSYTVRCKNNGFVNNGECVCPPHWNGDDCGVPMCENGGTAIHDGTCRCPPLFAGDFCSLPKCDPAYPDNFKRTERTLVIALETSFTMSTSIFYLGNSLVDSIGKLIEKRPGWFDTFVLVPFDSTSNKDKWYAPTVTYNYKDLDAALDKIPTGECPGDPSCSDPNCPRPIGQLLLDTLDQPYLSNPDSVIVVITNSAIEDHNLMYDITQKLIATKAQLHFVVAPSASPCSLGWDDEMNKAMQYFATFAVGTVSSVVPKQLPNYFSEFLPAMYNAQEIVIDSQYVKECSAKEHVFQVDHSTNEFNLQFFGVEADTISMTGPLGPVVIPPNALPGSSTYFGVFPVDYQLIVPGTYIVRTKSAGINCDLKVRASTDILVDVGFTQVHDTVNGDSQDDAHYSGLFGVPNKAMFHVQGLEEGGALQYAQIISPRGNVIATRNVIRRVSSCTYTYVMDGTFDCDFTDMEVVVYGVDMQNSPFHRNFRAHCTDNRPQPIPPNPTCDLGALRADIGFLVDTSVDKNALNYFKLFVTQMMGGRLTLGREQTQFGMMSLSDAPEQGGFFSFRFGSDKSTFVSFVDSIQPDGHVGQNITSAIPALMRDIYTKDNGYRGDDKSVKKLLVYLTANNPTDDDPDNAIISLINSKITGVAVATFRLTNPSKKMLSLVDPHCFYAGPTDASFSTLGPKFMLNLLCSDQPVCGMPPLE